MCIEVKQTLSYQHSTFGNCLFVSLSCLTAIKFDINIEKTTNLKHLCCNSDSKIFCVKYPGKIFLHF